MLMLSAQEDKSSIQLVNYAYRVPAIAQIALMLIIINVHRALKIIQKAYLILLLVFKAASKVRFRFQINLAQKAKSKDASNMILTKLVLSVTQIQLQIQAKNAILNQIFVLQNTILFNNHIHKINVQKVAKNRIIRTRALKYVKKLYSAFNLTKVHHNSNIQLRKQATFLQTNI
ncbi:transmembrane protein, putative (macronuclear) [Tetrahymena thermophila SB210]|uniref:Transmembrane protein, putative n=1 Tax=Tetrahymena thermophila (strain SB210) TaxID=312017 RepID=Q23MJ6_TETTS|nr:transmembrane protein, putative [Tetrahymena thermophila SB210]EAR97770.3 transmembrane protein, putative [Tetrahymena thermophila SB210]|eukprot:XP_001018015.3 transmembrane protein, putative [Tetrahymena thermophila SB210]